MSQEITEAEMLAMEEGARNDSTSKSTRLAAARFEKWCEKRSKPLNWLTSTAADLNDWLRSFYAELKNAGTGKALSPSSLVGIRAGIQRKLKQAPISRNLNILTGEEFMSANVMLEARCKGYVQEGNALPQHKTPIEDADKVKLEAYFAERYVRDPVALSQKIWYDLCYYFGRRGRENWCELTKDSFQVGHNAEGEAYLALAKTERSKNHQGGAKRADQHYVNAKIYGDLPSDYQFYLSKLNPACDRLFQKPSKNAKYPVPFSCQVWFTNSPMGKNTLGEMMATISRTAGLSRKYTNHCVRATTVTDLVQADVPSEQVITLTGHKNTSSLKHYVGDTSEAQKRKMSETLSSAKHAKRAT